MVDRATVVGLGLTLVLLLGVMVLGTGLSAHVFWQASSLALVLGGAVLTTVMASPLTRLRAVAGMLKTAFRVPTHAVEETLITLVALAEIARRQGLLALDRPVIGLRDAFLKRAVQMAIDGYDPANIRQILQAEMESTDLRHRDNWSILESVGRSAPTFGMIGTLIGLVVMLGKMDDPSKIGPGMAVALLTTLYGLVIANVFCLPLVRKLAQRNSEEMLCKTAILEGVLAIQAGEHPRVLASRIEVYLPPERRGKRIPRMAAGSTSVAPLTYGPAAAVTPQRQPVSQGVAATGEKAPPRGLAVGGPAGASTAKGSQDDRRKLVGVA